MEWLKQIAMFALQATVIVAGSVVVLTVLYGLFTRGRRRGPHLEVNHLNQRYRNLSRALRSAIVDKKSWKAERKAEKKQDKLRADQTRRPTTYVLDFKGDIRARAAEALREEVTTILNTASSDDEVILRLESPGGMVPHYGLAASQLQRLKDRHIPLTICVDKVAASGGYMMACLADRLVAAPFAIVGSIGVAAPMPNFHRLLKKNNIDYEEFTAGEYKRTVTIFGEVTPKGRKKFGEQLEETHQLFKQLVGQSRPELDVDLVSTGEYWYASDGIHKKLVDQLATSDEILAQRAETHELYEVRYHSGQNIRDRMSNWTVNTLGEAFTRAWDTVLHGRPS